MTPEARYLIEWSRLPNEFYLKFREGLRNTPGGEALTDEQLGTAPERSILGMLFTAFQLHHDEHTVRELFAEFAPKKKRQLSTDRWELVALLYGRHGKPPVLQFAKRLARINAAMRKEGRPRRDLYGTGTTNVDNMHHRLKEILRERKYREIADMHFDMQKRWDKHF